MGGGPSQRGTVGVLPPKVVLSILWMRIRRRSAVSWFGSCWSWGWTWMMNVEVTVANRPACEPSWTLGRILLLHGGTLVEPSWTDGRACSCLHKGLKMVRGCEIKLTHPRPGRIPRFPFPFPHVPESLLRLDIRGV